MENKQLKRGKNRESTVSENDIKQDVRLSNIVAAISVADCIRTSLGPRGMDKMILQPKNEVVISNDGATILNKLQVSHPTAKMLVQLSKSQDIEAGDGTTSVVIIAGSLLNSCQKLLEKGIHPTVISEAFGKCSEKAVEILDNMAIKLDLSDKKPLVKAARTSLSSKIISQYSDVLGPLVVDAVYSVIDPETANNVDLNDIKVVKKIGSTLDKTEIVDGLVFPQTATKSSGGPSKMENAKIALIQFCLSPPKTDMDSNIIIHDSDQIDRMLKEERDYLLNMCKTIKQSGCNVLLIQKSILRDSSTEMSLEFLAKMKIMVVEDIERKDVEFIAKTLNLKPIATIESFKKEKLGHAKIVEEVNVGDGRVVKITGIQNKGKTVSILCRASNKTVLDEAERSLHDALCVIRSIVKKKKLIAGGGAGECEMSLQLKKYAKELKGNDSVCCRAFAEALEIIPTTLAENAGLKPISITTELRNLHTNGKTNHGISVKEGKISDMVEEDVLQPLLVSTSAITLATETVRMILKIDDIIEVR